MASLVDIHTAIEERLATIPGLRPFDHPVQGATPPFAYPAHTGGEQVAMGRTGPVTYQFVVVVITAQTIRPVDGYRALMEFADLIGDRSIRLAIWDGNGDTDATRGTFAGLATTSAKPGEWRETGVDDFDALQGYGGIFAVEIHTKGP